MTAQFEQQIGEVNLRDVEIRLEIPELQNGLMFEVMRRQEGTKAYHFDLTVGTLSEAAWNYGVDIQV